jgi:hypothetical protein
MGISWTLIGQATSDHINSASMLPPTSPYRIGKFSSSSPASTQHTFRLHSLAPLGSGSAPPRRDAFDEVDILTNRNDGCHPNDSISAQQ